MTTFTKTILELDGKMSIENIEKELQLHTDFDEEKMRTALLATVQELALAIVVIQKELKFRD